MREDILNNTRKWEMLFETPEKPTEDRGLNLRHNTRGRWYRRHDEWEHWWRIFNDGKCDMENLPFYREYHDYKEWADKIDEKALSTLRMLVDKLLLDHTKESTDFTGSLSKLHKLLNND